MTVLDASALLAWLHDEPGAERVDPFLEEARISAVNWSEVMQKALHRGVDTRGLQEDLTALGAKIVPFSTAQAEDAASLWPVTRSLGLSLADRACLALARALGAPVLTADGAWSELEVGIQVQPIR